MSGLSFPFAEYDEDNAALLCVPIGFIPLYRRFFEFLQRRSSWADRESWWRGYQLAAQAEECLMSGCLDKLIESNNQIYRLLDRSLNGTAYVATPDPIDPINNPPIISPAIADVPPTTALAPGLLARFERLLKLTDNMATGRIYPLDVQNPGDPLLDNIVGVRETITNLQGIINAGWFGIGGENATIADVVNALRVGSDGQRDNILDTIDQMLGVGANAASIFNAVRALFTETVDLASEGAMVGVLIASTLASAALASQQQQQTTELLTKLDKVLLALRGAADPTDNILLALRGDEAATAERNLAAFADEIEPILVAIGEQLT